MKDYDQPVSVRVPAGLKADLRVWAEQEGRTLGNLVLRILTLAVAEWRAAQPAEPPDVAPEPPNP